jgi:hypothetical protein
MLAGAEVDGATHCASTADRSVLVGMSFIGDLIPRPAFRQLIKYAIYRRPSLGRHWIFPVQFPPVLAQRVLSAVN